MNKPITMSFSQNLEKQVGKVISSFIDAIVNEYGDKVERKTLEKLWSGTEAPKTTRKRSGAPDLGDFDTNDLSPGRLATCSVVELKALCRTHGYKVSGAKALLIDRLLGKDGEAKSKPVVKTSKSDDKKPVHKETDIIKKLKSKIPTIPIRRNEFGNMCHPETQLVFDPKLGKVIGKQNDNGEIDDLNDDDIQSCKKFKFDYQVPDNLDKNNLDDVSINGVDNDSEVDDSESDVELVKDEEESDVNVDSEEDEEVLSDSD